MWLWLKLGPAGGPGLNPAPARLKHGPKASPGGKMTRTRPKKKIIFLLFLFYLMQFYYAVYFIQLQIFELIKLGTSIFSGIVFSMDSSTIFESFKIDYSNFLFFYQNLTLKRYTA